MGKKQFILFFTIAGAMTIYSCCGKSKKSEPAILPAAVVLTPPDTSQEAVMTDTLLFANIYYQRKGGGNIGYEILPGKDSTLFHVKELRFRPADTTFSLPNSQLDSSAIATMDSLLKGKLSPGEPDTTPKKGPFMMTGTWSHAFLTQSDSVRTPIHDKRIVEKIATTEEAVRNAIKN
ncbi:MAG: hypothetical protein J6T67_07825 [Paludibacteraceae bacterium]|nr:hypothetical protein [Paludibacteraceae bacterium]